MHADLTPAQSLVVFGLLVCGGTSLQAELVPKPRPADVASLRTARLVDAGRQGRRVLLSLTDAGWAWADGNLTAELPAAHETLHRWLVRLDTHLRRSRRTLARFIDPGPRRATREARTAGEPATPAAKPPTPAALRKRIEAAYLVLTDGRRDEGVRLSQIRTQLGDLDRAVVDRAFGRILAGDRTATLMRHDDPRQIGAADRAAAFAPAGEPFHLLWIAS